MAHTPVLDRTAPASAPARVWPPVVALLLLAGGYALFVVAPYYANGLHHEPLADVAAGYHDPKDLWPLREPGPFAGLVGSGGLFTVLLGPLLVPVVPVWAAVSTWSGRRTLTAARRWVLGVVVVAGAALAAWVYSPFGQALAAWKLD